MNKSMLRALVLGLVTVSFACGEPAAPSAPSAAGGGAGNAGGSGGSSKGGSGGSGKAGSGGVTGGVTGGGAGPGTGGAGPSTGSGGVGAGGAAGAGSGGAGAGGAGGNAGGTGGAAGAPADSAAPSEVQPPNSAELAALDKACTPIFTLKLEDKGPKGALFTEAVGGNAEAFVQDIGRKVCRVLYRKASEVRAANSIELTIKDYDGVAGKWGDVGEIGVEISTRHLDNIKREGKDVRAEIAGILHHEMTHMYQHDDKPEATFPGMAAMYESVADGVRIRNGLAPSGCAPTNKSGVWSSHSYCSGGWFWVWAETNHPDFLYRLNATMKGKDGKPWAPADATSITGKTIDALWNDYKAAACCSGSQRSCCTVLAP